MEQKEIKKNIEEAVRLYKEMLEINYLKKKKPFYASGFHLLTNIFTGKVNINRKTNGNLRISGELPKSVFRDSCKGLPMKTDDWAILPVVFTWFQDDVAEKEK